MQSPNSPATLNPLEERILGTVPAGSKHVAVIGAGDGRLAREIKKNLGDDVQVYVVEPREALQRYLGDFAGAGRDPWDVAAFEAAARQHGAFDCMVFYGLHEYWRGHMRRFQQLIGLARPDAVIWATFVNLSALRHLQQQLPPLQLNADALASPTRLWARLDYASWVAMGAMLNARIEMVWGLFDEKAYAYVEQAGQAGPPSWDMKGTKIDARTPAEAVQWGAAYLGIQMIARPQSAPRTEGQALGGAAFNSHIYQSLIDPYPETTGEEADVAWAVTEVGAIESGRSSVRPSQIVDFVLGLVENPDTVRDVLLVGAGWGRDVFMLKLARPEWNPIGVENSAAMIAVGRSFCEKEGVRVEHFDLGSRMPFEDKSFDVVITLGFMSHLFDPAAAAVAQEILRVTRKGVYHLEDARGVEYSLRLKQNSLAEIYTLHGKKAETRPLIIEGQQTGFMFTKVVI